jgi:hypothetical protein
MVRTAFIEPIKHQGRLATNQALARQISVSYGVIDRVALGVGDRRLVWPSPVVVREVDPLIAAVEHRHDERERNTGEVCMKREYC